MATDNPIKDRLNLELKINSHEKQYLLLGFAAVSYSM